MRKNARLFAQELRIMHPASNFPVTPRQCRSTEVDLHWIAKQLGMANRPRRAVIDRVRALADPRSPAPFPLPKTPRFKAGERITGPRSIDAHSIWDRDPVEIWFEDDRPPAESASLVAIRRSNVAEQLSARALQLVAA
jgi:hypothetical protein